MIERMGDMRETILIGSNGGLTGIYLARYYSKLGCFRVIGMDSMEKSAGRFFVDKQITIPSADKPTFIEELINIIKSEHVSYYIPTHSKEIKVISRNEDYIRSQCNCLFCVSPYATFESLENKKKATINLLEEGLCAPKIVNLETAVYPIIMKKDIGSGGNGTIRIDNYEVHNAYVSTKSDVTFYELLSGSEYTVDCLFDMDGQLVGYNNRERVKTIGGAVIISENENDVNIKRWIEKLASKWKFRGCVNFQYILKDDMPYFIDINLRFPAGGLPLTVESGLNIPELLLRIMRNEKVPMGLVVDTKKTMYRYFEECYEDN